MHVEIVLHHWDHGHRSQYDNGRVNNFFPKNCTCGISAFCCEDCTVGTHLCDTAGMLSTLKMDWN